MKNKARIPNEELAPPAAVGVWGHQEKQQARCGADGPGPRSTPECATYYLPWTEPTAGERENLHMRPGPTCSDDDSYPWPEDRVEGLSYDYYIGTPPEPYRPWASDLPRRTIFQWAGDCFVEGDADPYLDWKPLASKGTA